MKRILYILALTFCFVGTRAQDFNKDMGTAKTSYSLGKLEETHFALLQAMQEIDIIVGKEILKLLPLKMDTLTSNAKNDNVSSAVGFIGTTIHRVYGMSERKADLNIISNSPMIAMLNGFLNSPVLGGMMTDGKTKAVRVQGYKGRLEKIDGSVEGKSGYELQIPLGNTLITFRINDCTDTQILDMANTIPMQQIAKLIQ